ncbi:MAG: L,D-transpeptidase [Hyphomicrobiales bacterium]|nr:L,D-transpeptidase [Alphaproteobacteria bacterium]
MLRTHHSNLAVSAIAAATMLFSASASAQSLAMNDPTFPFGGIFRQVVREPAPMAPDESITEDNSGATDERFRRQMVAYNGNEAPGTVIIDTPNTYLYFVLGRGRAIRYGIGVGREGFTWAGTQTVARKQEWPDWHPPAEMIERQPYLPRFMAGGPGNPLGARAMYLGNTMYRIHGTNAPETIGQRVSSGCIRLTNEDVTDLFNRVSVGAKVVVMPINGQGLAQRQAPVRQRVSSINDASRPTSLVPHTLASGSSASRLY